jgi:hypothetical protein
VIVLGGVVLDLALVPSATAFGPALLAAWFAATATRRREAVGGWLVAGAALAVSVASLAAPSAIGAWVQRDDGGVVRTAAVGVALVVAGLVRWRPGADPTPE